MGPTAISQPFFPANNLSFQVERAHSPWLSLPPHFIPNQSPCWWPRRYKAFINRVTPEEWFEGERAAREAKKAAMKEAWRVECGAVAQRKMDAAAAKQHAEHDMQWARTQQQFEKAERAYRESLVALRETALLQVG